MFWVVAFGLRFRVLGLRSTFSGVVVFVVTDLYHPSIKKISILNIVKDHSVTCLSNSGNER